MPRYPARMYSHGTIAADGRHALFPSPEQRIAAARTLARTGREALILFCAADDHVHVLVRGERTATGPLGGHLRQALRQVAAGPLQPMRWTPVETRGHLESLVPYILDQTSHHALATAEHPATWPGSCFLDLVGARLLPGFSAEPLRESLPRLPRERVWGAVGLPPLEPADDERLASLGVRALVIAAQGALGRTDLHGKTPDAVRGRVVVARLARHLGVPERSTLAALGVAGRTLRDLATNAADPHLERAVRVWVAVHSAVARVASPAA